MIAPRRSMTVGAEVLAGGAHVCWFAPTALYGSPDDLRAFIDRAHALGLGVILDVVYNHFGPEGNYLPHFSDNYSTDKYPNEWGEALNFDGPHSAPVREYVKENAAYWIREFHFHRLRLDATQQIFDDSSEYIVAELARYAREAAGKREIVIIAENEPQDARLVRSAAKGGFGLDAIWNDDLHHSCRVALTDPLYGGGGVRASENTDGVWHLPGHAAVLLAAIQNHVADIGKQP